MVVPQASAADAAALNSGNGHSDATGRGLLRLAIGAVGVVFGDIGTSPLYAIKEAFSPAHGLVLNHANVLGVLSSCFGPW